MEGRSSVSFLGASEALFPLSVSYRPVIDSSTGTVECIPLSTCIKLSLHGLRNDVFHEVKCVPLILPGLAHLSTFFLKRWMRFLDVWRGRNESFLSGRELGVPRLVPLSRSCTLLMLIDNMREIKSPRGILLIPRCFPIFRFPYQPQICWPSRMRGATLENKKKGVAMHVCWGIEAQILAYIPPCL